MAPSLLIPGHFHSTVTLVTLSYKLFNKTGDTEDLQHVHLKCRRAW